MIRYIVVVLLCNAHDTKCTKYDLALYSNLTTCVRDAHDLEAAHVKPHSRVWCEIDEPNRDRYRVKAYIEK